LVEAFEAAPAGTSKGTLSSCAEPFCLFVTTLYLIVQSEGSIPPVIDATAASRSLKRRQSTAHKNDFAITQAPERAFRSGIEIVEVDTRLLR
jgi:hypothetical protein